MEDFELGMKTQELRGGGKFSELNSEIVTYLNIIF
jgi:hypothetical protein